MKSLAKALRRMNPAVRGRRPATARLMAEQLERRDVPATFGVTSAGQFLLNPGVGQVVLDNNCAAIGTDPGGNIAYELKYDGKLWMYNNTTATFTGLDMNVASFHVNANGQLEDLETNGDLWWRSAGAAGAWTLIDGNGDVTWADIDKNGANGDVFYLKTDSTVSRWTQATSSSAVIVFTAAEAKLGGPNHDQLYIRAGTDLFTADNTNLYYWNGGLVNVTNAIDGLEGAGSNYTIFANGPNDWGVDNNGNVWISTFNSNTGNYALTVYSGAANLTTDVDPNTSGNFARLAMTPDGSQIYFIFSINATGSDQFWRFTTATFAFTQLRQGGINTMANVYAGFDDNGYVTDFVSGSYFLYFATATTGPGGATKADPNALLNSGSIALGPNGNLFVLENTTNVTNYNSAFPLGGAGNAWDSGANLIATLPNGQYVEGKTNGKLFIWQGSALGWTQLDGNYKSFAISGNGQLFELQKSGNLWNWYQGTPGWLEIDTNVSQYFLAYDGALVYNRQGEVWLYGKSNISDIEPFFNPNPGVVPYLHVATGTIFISNDWDFITATKLNPLPSESFAV